jgi:hypothetical protein
VDLLEVDAVPEKLRLDMLVNVNIKLKFARASPKFRSDVYHTRKMGDGDVVLILYNHNENVKNL